MSWYSTGYDGVAKEEQRIQTMMGPNRLWLPAGTGREIVLVDDVAFNIYEHNAKINNSWQNHHTCNRGEDGDTCYSCQHLGDKSKAFTGYLTCVDCSEYTDKKGNKHQYEMKLVGGKLTLLKKWERKRQDKGSLVFTRWKLHREDDKKPATGDEWEGLGEVKDPDKLFALANYRGKKLSDLWDKADANPEAMMTLKRTFQLEIGSNGKLVRRVVAFNYMELLKPRGNQWSKDLLAGISREEALPDNKGSETSGTAGTSASEDDVPF